MTIDQFQKKWGLQWAAVIDSGIIADAVSAIDEATNTMRIDHLTDDRIRDNGATILARQQGFSLFKTTLLSLADVPEEHSDALVEDYPDELPVTQNQRQK